MNNRIFFIYSRLNLANLQLMTIAVVIFGAVSIVKSSLNLADLLTFILYIGILSFLMKQLVRSTMKAKRLCKIL